MSKGHSLLRAVTAIGLILAVLVSMNAEAGLFGLGGTSWQEEVLLHDGQKIIVKRSQSSGGRHEIGQGGTIAAQEISFTLPNSNAIFTFKDEYSEDIGGRNFSLLALHVLNGTPYVVAQPWLCLAENKWGRPSPPYVFFKHNGKAWQQVALAEFPPEFTTINLIVNDGRQDAIKKLASKRGYVTTEDVRKINGSLTQPEYHSILREALTRKGPGSCSEMIYGGKDSGWHGVGLFGKTYDACLQYCRREKIGFEYCPCETLFKGKQ